MDKKDPNLTGLSKQKTFDQKETLPDLKSDKVWHSSVNQMKNNKPPKDK